MTKRPSGLLILSFIYIVIASVGLTFIIYSTEFTDLMQLDNLISVFIFMLLLSAAIGLIVGKKWGWWIISFLTLFSIISKIPILYWSLSNFEVIPDVGKFYLKHAGKMFLQILILIFLFQENVNAYFQFKQSNFTKRLGVLFILVLVVYTILFLVSYI